MHDIVVKASDAPGGTVQLFDKQRLRRRDAAPPPLWTWTPGQSVPALTTTSLAQELLFTKSLSLGGKLRTQVMTFSAPRHKQAGPLGLTLLARLLTELQHGVLPAEPSYHLGYLIRLGEFRAAGAGVTGRKAELPSRPSALQPLLGVEVGRKIAAGGEGQVLLAAPQQRAWDKLEAGVRGTNFAVVVDGQGLYGSDLDRAPPIIFKESFVTMMDPRNFA